MTSKFPAHGRGSRPRQCRECGVKRSADVTISARGLCRPCAAERIIAPSIELVAREGPVYESWRKSMIAVGERLARS